ncbi:MAG: OmpA family protein [Bacteroidota bacterium]
MDLPRKIWLVGIGIIAFLYPVDMQGQLFPKNGRVRKSQARGENGKKTLMVGNTAIINEKSVLLRGEDSLYMPEKLYPDFENLKKVPYYRNKELAKQIERAEKKGDIFLLDELLQQYISNFGILNFRVDHEVLWKAAQVKEELQDTLMASYYYGLVYKHNPMGMAISRVRRDSLLIPTLVDWVPIEKYYELLKLRSYIDTLQPPKVLQSMGPKINTEHPEYAPYTHASDQVLLFSSRREIKDFSDPFGRKNEDLYLSYRGYAFGDTTVWDTAQKLPGTINTQFNEGSASLSPGGNILYFTRCGDVPGGFGDCDIYISYKSPKGIWSKPRNLGPNVNTEYWESQPNLSSDGQTLYFTSNRKGGFGGTDLYATRYNEVDDSWGPASNLGPMINTHQDEVTPFFHKINETLYFSSNGQLKNFGGYDIFKSRFLQNTWDEPKNLGPLVNTYGNEYYFSVDGQGQTIFYSRSEGKEESMLKQNFDLYSFPMPMEARPDAITTLKGYLVDAKTGNPLIGTVMIIDLDRQIEVAPKKINPNGYFEFDLIKNNRYRIYILGENFLTVKKELNVQADTTFEIFVQSIRQDKPLVFESLQFNSNNFKFRATAKPQLDYLVEFLTNYPMFILEVEGHTDSDGEESSNEILSEKRARYIADYIIVEGGFAPERLRAKGYGASRPIVPNDSEENKRRNRRVEFKLLLDPTYTGDKWLPTEEELYFRRNKENSEDKKLEKSEKKNNPDG